MLAPAFLLGLLAIGLPIWLHRVARANPTHHPFASLMFLEASETQRTAKRTIRYWLLLAMRIALLVALAFAFAGPLLSERIAAQGANAKLHAIVIDASLSMQHGDRWRRALAEAEKIIDGVGGADRVMLVRASGRKISVVHEAVNASSAGSVRARLQGLTPGVERLDYGLLMTTARSWLGTPRPPTQLHLISDMQRSAGPVRFADLEPPADTTLVVHDLGEAAAVNTYIESVSFTAADIRTLEVAVRTNATTPQRREVIVSVDGKEQARSAIGVQEPRGTEGAPAVSATWPAGDANATPTAPTVGKVLFPDLKLAAGTHRLEVSLEPGDELPQDDRFRAVIEHVDPRVLLVSRSPNADETAYFGAAIGSLSAPVLRVDQGNSEVAETNPLGNFSAVVVADTNALSNAAATRIRDYVVGGGALLATLGQATSTQRASLLEGMGAPKLSEQPAAVAEIVTSHPVLREAGDWHRVRFFRHWQVEPGENDKVLMTLDDGSPLLIERTMGAGRLLLLTAPLDRAWNDLAIHPVFVSFIAEAARYLTGHDSSAVSSTAGAVVMTGLTAAAGGQIFDPEGRRVLGLADTSTADRLIPELTGFYEVRGAQGVRWLAVNVDARESDLTHLPKEFIGRWQALRAPQPAPVESAAPDAPKPPISRSLGPLLLLLAAGLLFVELLLANHHLAIRREAPR
jgi:hypothetical protein